MLTHFSKKVNFYSDKVTLTKVREKQQHGVTHGLQALVVTQYLPYRRS
jgi:hypothetical protein